MSNHRPNCSCASCTSRRRKEEAIANGTRPPDAVAKAKRRQQADAKEAVINANLPELRGGRKRGVRDRILQYIELRAIYPDLKTADIAQKMGLRPVSLYGYITQATREGWLKFDDPIERLDNEIVPKVLDNLNKLLDKGDAKTTIETAKGTIFPSYKNAKGIQDGPVQQVLAIKFEMPTAPAALETDSKPANVIQGVIVGTPKELPNGGTN